MCGSLPKNGWLPTPPPSPDQQAGGITHSRPPLPRLPRCTVARLRSERVPHKRTNRIHRMQILENERSFGPMPTSSRTAVSLPAVHPQSVSFDDEDVEPSLPEWKRALDLIAIIVSSPIWLTLMMGLSVWIKMVSPGPFFYTQVRVGFRGKRF